MNEIKEIFALILFVLSSAFTFFIVKYLSYCFLERHFIRDIHDMAQNDNRNGSGLYAKPQLCIKRLKNGEQQWYSSYTLSIFAIEEIVEDMWNNVPSSILALFATLIHVCTFVYLLTEKI